MRRLLRWWRLGHPQPTLADVWASLLLTEPPCTGSISDMIATDMLVQDEMRKLGWT